MSLYSFGNFVLEAAHKRLSRGDAAIDLSEHQVDVLLHLVTHPNDVVSKDALIEAAWQGVAVTDNSLEQAISVLRKALGDSSRKPKLIETVPRRGYRFRGEVTVSEPRVSDEEIEAMLAPYRAWVEGRVALETLERDAVLRAEAVFERAVAQSPNFAPAHLGLANACVMHFESTRADEMPDADALLRAGHHAREACRLDARSGEAWATLAFVLHRTNMGVRAIAAARRAVMLEPDNWRHHFRLAYVGWGEERLRAAQRTLALFPDFALARWLSATVHVARNAHAEAERELRAGAAAQDAQDAGGHGAFAAVGLHWLLGLVLLARGDEEAALQELQRELAFEHVGQVYGRECCANTWYAIGAVMARQGRRIEAIGAFEHALERVPGHLMATAGLVLTEKRLLIEAQEQLAKRLEQFEEAGFLVDAALARAAVEAGGGDVPRAAQHIDDALSIAPAGSSGWLIPVEPLVRIDTHAPAFDHVLARLRTRAA